MGTSVALALPAGAEAIGSGTGFGVSPTLPAGLVLNPDNGQVAGTPAAALGATVFTLERVPELAEHARTVLAAEGYGGRVTVRIGDGYAGWPEHAPYDAIMVACAAETVPAVLVEQLGEGGRMILPVGPVWGAQRLVYLSKKDGRVEQTDDLPVRFVPMIGG